MGAFRGDYQVAAPLSRDLRAVNLTKEADAGWPATTRGRVCDLNEQYKNSTKRESMNKTTIKWTALVLTGAGVTAGWLVAQGQEDTYRPGQQRTSQTTTTTIPGSTAEVRKINKVSELIGMNVKNPQGEKLGDIRT